MSWTVTGLHFYNLSFEDGYKWNLSVHHFLDLLLSLNIILQRFSHLSHVVILISFLWLGSNPCHECTNLALTEDV